MERSNVAMLRPTVLLGLGGTGHDLLLQIKKRLIDRFEEVPPCIALLSIDGADPDTPALQASNGKPVVLDPMTERFLIQVSNSENLIGDTNEHIAQWWPPDTPVSAITAGATQIRPRGRLGFFAKYTQIVAALESAILKVTNARTLAGLDELGIQRSDRLGIDVYILSSLAGGTGSGMLLDVAFNVRKLCDAATNITGILVLPRVFSRDPGIRQKPNSYAALKEIEFFMKIRQGQSFTINYGGDSAVHVSKPPLDLAFLVDNINEHGSSIDRQDLFSVVGEGIFLLISSQVGSKSSNSLDNIKGKLSGIGTIRARSAAYCSFGVASLTVDRRQRQLQEAKDSRAGALRLMDQLLMSRRADEGQERLFDILSEETIENLLATAQRDDQGAPIEVSFGVLGLTKERNRIAMELKARYDRRKKDVERAVARAVENTTTTGRAEIDRRGREWWSGRVNSLGGLEEIVRQASLFIEDLTARLDILKQRATEQEDKLGQFKREGEAVLSQIGNATGFLDSLLKKLPWNDNIEVQVTKVSNLFVNELTSYRELESLRAVIQLLESAQGLLERYQSEAREIRGPLELAKSSLESFDAKSTLEEAKSPFEHTIEAPGHTAPEVSASKFIEWFNKEHGSMEAMKKRSSDEVVKLVYNFTANGSAASQNGTIESALGKDRERIKPILKRLSDLASPLWSPDESKIPLPHETVLELSCYGVYDADKSLLRELHESALGARSAPTFVSLFDHDRISLFRIKAGVPLFALSGLEDLETAYYRQSDRATCHLDKRWKSFPDLIPARNKTLFHEARSMALLWFVAALAPPPFSFIVEKNGGYFAVSNEPEKDLSLGDGFGRAFTVFSEDRNLVKKIEGQVRNVIKQVAEREVLDALEKELELLREGRRERKTDFEATGLFETAIVMLEEFVEKPSSFPSVD